MPFAAGSPAQRLMGRQDACDIVEADHASLIWIPGPAGTGKTCLALEYMAATGRPAVWFQMDLADAADPCEFFHRFGACIAAAGVAPGWVMPTPLPEHLPMLHGFARLFIRTLAARLAPGVCVILDNVHECDDQPFFPRLLDIMAAEFPRGTTILLLSRRGPPPACARLQVHGDMRIVPTQMLMLPPAESERLLRHLGVPEAAAVGEAVYHAAGGWPAGIAMAAAVLRHRGACELDARILLEPTAQHYFAHEVYSLLDDAERHALLTVCWLARIPSGCWADAQLESPLGRLLAGGALMRRFDDGSVALNPLLQSFLRGWARRVLSPEEQQQRIDRCIELLMAEGLCEDAVELSLAHHRLAHATGLIAQRAPALLAQSCHQTVARWIEALPETARTGELNYWLGTALKLSAPQRAREALTAALSQFEASGDRASRYLALGAIVGTYFADSTGCEPLQELVARHAIDHQSDFDNLVDERQRSNLIFSIGTGILSAEPGHPQWGMWEQRAFDVIHAPGDVETRMRLVTMLSHYYFLSGRHKRLLMLIETLDRSGLGCGLSGYGRSLKGLVLLYRALVLSSDDVAQVYGETRQCSDDTGVSFMDGHCASLFASALIVQGCTDDASRLLDELSARTPSGHRLQHAHVSQGRAWVANWTGDHKAALDHAREGIAAAGAIGSVPFVMLARMAEAVALAFIHPEECRERIDDLQRAARQHDYPYLTTHTELLLAWLELHSPDVRDDVVAGCLSRGLRLLEEVGTGMLITGIPQILGPVCDFALEHGIECEAALRIIQRFRLAPPPHASRHWPWPIRIRCLGTFQLDIDGQAYDPGRKSKHRQLDLLKLLAAHAPQAQSIQVVAGCLWPEADESAAMRNFNTTLSRLRGLVGHQALLVEQGTLRLNPAIVFVDVAELRCWLNELDEALAFSNAEGTQVEGTAWRILNRYSGHLLAGESSVLYSRLRDTMRNRVTSALARAVACLPKSTAPSRLVHLLERSLETDPSADAIALELVRTLMTQGQHGAALKAYRRYQMATQLVGVKPLRELQQIASTLYADAQ